MVREIPVDHEGELLYTLRQDGNGNENGADTLLVEVSIKANIKVVTLRSTYKVENRTLLPIEIILVDGSGCQSRPLQRICRSFP